MYARLFINKMTAAMMVMAASLLLTACVGALPGGSEDVNAKFYESDAILKQWVADLQPGMTKAEVFARLGRTQSDFIKLNRGEIVGVLFGSKDMGVPYQQQANDENIQTFLNSLEGYRLMFKSIKKRHGFRSPIRIQTDSKGFDYILNLVFRDGFLYEKPILLGGVVTGTNSKTLFDYLNPGTFLNQVIE